jgi:hypothetical protein
LVKRYFFYHTQLGWFQHRNSCCQQRITELHCDIFCKFS